MIPLQLTDVSWLWLWNADLLYELQFTHADPRATSILCVCSKLEGWERLGTNMNGMVVPGTL